MPSLQYNIDRIIDSVPVLSATQALAAIDEIQQVVYSHDMEQTLYLDPATGMPPLMTTVAGTYQYNAPANCRRTKAIFSSCSGFNYSRARPVGPQKEYYFRNKGFYLIDADTRDANYGTYATVTFRNDPGNTTDKYYHAYWLKVTALSSASDLLQLPEHTHYMMRKAVIAMLKSEEYGESGQDLILVEKFSKMIRNALNSGYQSRPGRTPMPEEYQTYSTNEYRF